MATLNELKKYLNYEFSNGSYTGKDYKVFKLSTSTQYEHSHDATYICNKMCRSWHCTKGCAKMVRPLNN